MRYPFSHKIIIIGCITSLWVVYGMAGYCMETGNVFRENEEELPFLYISNIADSVVALEARVEPGYSDSSGNFQSQFGLGSHPAIEESAESPEKVLQLTGIVVGKRGYVITLGWFMDQMLEIYAVTAEGVRYPAEVIAYDTQHNMSLLQIKKLRDKVPVIFRGIDHVDHTDWIVAIGNPNESRFPQNGGHLFLRYVPDLQRHLVEFTYDAGSISQSGLGGPILDSTGNVLGMISKLNYMDPELKKITGIAISSREIEAFLEARAFEIEMAEPDEYSRSVVSGQFTTLPENPGPGCDIICRYSVPLDHFWKIPDMILLNILHYPDLITSTVEMVRDGREWHATIPSDQIYGRLLAFTIDVIDHGVIHRDFLDEANSVRISEGTEQDDVMILTVQGIYSINKGKLVEGKQILQKARTQLEKYIERNPGHTESLVSLARNIEWQSIFRAELPVEVEKIINDLERQDLKNQEFYFYAGSFYLRHGFPENAEKYADLLHANYPGSIYTESIMYNLADYHLKTNEIMGLRRIYNFLSDYPESRHFEHVARQFLRRSLKYTDFLAMRERVLQAMITRNSRNVNFYNEYAWTNIQLDRLQVAWGAAHNVVNLLGKDVSRNKAGGIALAILGWIKYRQETKISGLTQFHQALTGLHLSHSDIFYHRLLFLHASSHLDKQEFSEAVHLLKKLWDSKDFISHRDGNLMFSINSELRKAYWHYMGSTKGFDLFFSAQTNDPESSGDSLGYFNLQDQHGMNISLKNNATSVLVVYCNSKTTESPDPRVDILRQIQDTFSKSVQVTVLHQGWDRDNSRLTAPDEDTVYGIQRLRPRIPEMTEGNVYLIKNGRIEAEITVRKTGLVDQLMTELHRLLPT